jgi:PTS system N-acetylglucosamine-specific IIC component
MIRAFDLKTPGREDDEEDELIEASSVSGDKYNTMAVAFIEALGGRDNVTAIDNCATRLRLQVVDIDKVNESAIKKNGAKGVMKVNKTNIQIIVGTDVEFVSDKMKQYKKGELK